ncbi:MAG: cation:proton antiporter, partial [Thiomonas sp.]|nr:cation:proton antiporter [Thiomonas sp.]
MTGLELTLLYLVAAVLGVALFRALSMPPMLGYLAVGVVIGPNALALAGDTSGMQHLAEFGVVFLMFSIGLEFSLGQLKAMRSLVFGLGATQVLAVMAAVLLTSLAFAYAMPTFWTQPVAAGIAIGGAFAMSSTAIVVKLLAEKIELDSPHGRHIIGVLLFQDLAVVPLLILIPALASHSDNLSWLLAGALLKAVLVLAVILLAGGRLLQPWLRIVVRRRSDELFML